MGRSVETLVTTRRYDFDWLRTFGAVMVVVGHCTMIFVPWLPNQTRGLLETVPASKLLGELDWNGNIWLMPLFMLLAGASAWNALRKRTNQQYLRERLVHLGGPFVAVMILFVVPMTYGTRSMSGEFNGSLLEFYLHFFEGIFPARNFNLLHLWFIFYLLIYIVVSLPLFRCLQSARGKAVINLLAQACQHPGGMYLFALPLVLVQVSLTAIAPPTLASAVVVNDGERFIELLAIYIIGYILLSDTRFQQALDRQLSFTLVMTATLSAAMFVYAWPDNFDPFSMIPLDYSGGYWAFWTLYALSTWSWLLTLLGLGRRFLNFNHPWLQFGTRMSFPVYLLHLIVWGPGVLLIGRLHLAAIPSALLLTALVLGGTITLIIALSRIGAVCLALLRRSHGSAAKPATTFAFDIASQTEFYT